MQVLFETDDLATVLWAELLAVLLRYKRAEPYRTDRGRDDKGKGGHVRGACMLRPKLKQPELDFIAAALPHLPTLPKMCSDIPSAKCLSAALVKTLSELLEKKITPLPLCVKRHLENACYFCGGGGHYTRHCKVIYDADELDRDFYIDMLPGQAEREEKAHQEWAELERKRKEEEEKKAKAKAKAKAKKKTTGVRKTIEKKEPRFGGVKRCGTPKSEVMRPCHEFNEEDRCTTCKRKRVNKGGGSAYTRKKAKKKKRRRRKKKKAKKKKRKARVKKFKVKRCTLRGLTCTFIKKPGGYRECKACRRRPEH